MNIQLITLSLSFSLHHPLIESAPRKLQTIVAPQRRYRLDIGGGLINHRADANRIILINGNVQPCDASGRFLRPGPC